jgi:hypothetical protein
MRVGALQELVAGLRSGAIEVIDLTAPLHQGTPILELPEQFGQTEPFQLHEISRYDDRGPAWYWNNFTTGEHTGTHFDAPIHWVTGKDGDDVSMVPPPRLIGPAAVIRRSPKTAASSCSWGVSAGSCWIMTVKIFCFVFCCQFVSGKALASGTGG